MTAHLGPKLILSDAEAERLVAEGWTRVKVSNFYGRDEPRDWLSDSDEAEGEFYIEFASAAFLFSHLPTAMAFKIRFG